MEDFVNWMMEIVKRRVDAGDLFDQLNYHYTPIFMLIAALTLMASQYVGQPIQCWFPAQFTDTWEAYAESYCYIKNTYHLPLRNPNRTQFKDNPYPYIPKSYGKRGELEINYYQWIPIVLVMQSVLFMLPCMMWRLFNWQSGRKFYIFEFKFGGVSLPSGKRT